MAEDELMGAEDILGIDDLKTEVVTVAQWGNKKVRVRGSTAAERDAYEESLYSVELNDKDEAVSKRNFTNAKARLVVQCIIDRNGKRVFPVEGEEKVAAALGQKSAGAINDLFQKITDLSGMSKKAKAVLEKNSAAGQGASVTTLPAT